MYLPQCIKGKRKEHFQMGFETVNGGRRPDMFRENFPELWGSNRGHRGQSQGPDMGVTYDWVHIQA